MKKIFVLLALLCTSSMLAASAQEIVIPRDTFVSVNVPKKVLSKHLDKSKEIKAVLSKDLIIENTSIARAGNPAIILVEKYKKAGFWGRGGYIAINGAIFYDNHNQQHKINLYETYRGAHDCKLTSIIPFNKGHQAVIKPSDIITGTLAEPFKFDTAVPESPVKSKK